MKRILDAIDQEIADLKEKINDLQEKRKLFTASAQVVPPAEVAEAEAEQPRMGRKTYHRPTGAEMERRKERLSKWLTVRKTFTIDDIADMLNIPYHSAYYLAIEQVPFKKQIKKLEGKYRRGKPLYESLVYGRATSSVKKEAPPKKPKRKLLRKRGAIHKELRAFLEEHPKFTREEISEALNINKNYADAICYAHKDWWIDTGVYRVENHGNYGTRVKIYVSTLHPSYKAFPVKEGFRWSSSAGILPPRKDESA